jgi:hypothetical protein
MSNDFSNVLRTATLPPTESTEENNNPFGVGHPSRGGGWDSYSQTFKPAMHAEGSAAGLGNGHPPGSILATAVKPGFGTPALDIRDDTIVTVQGMTMQARQAANLGVLRKEGGTYVETGRPAIVEQQPVQVDPVDAQLATLEARMGSDRVMALTEKVLRAGGWDGLTDADFRDSPMTRDAFIAQATDVFKRTQARIEATLTADIADGLAQWASQNAETRMEFDAAVREIHYRGDTRRIHALTKQMIRTLKAKKD